MIKKSNNWVLGLLGVIAFQTWFFLQRIDNPWNNVVDFNGAVWSQAAHNLLRAGLKTTLGVPAAFYFGPLPIPSSEYYGHHPALLHLLVAASFKLFGEHEWAARLIPIACSIFSTVILWLLVSHCAGRRPATFVSAIFAALPMELHYGAMVNFEPCTLMWLLLGLLGLRYWEATGGRKWWWLAVAAFTLSMLTAWLGFFFVALMCGHFAFTSKRRHRRLALLLTGIALVSVTVFLVQIRLVQAEAWQNLASAFHLRMSQNLAHGQSFTFYGWCRGVGNSIMVYLPPLPWVLALVGAVRVMRWRATREGLRWLGWVSLCFFVMSALYVCLFRNASFIHSYSAFYFTAPVAIMGGMGLETLASWIGELKTRAIGNATACAFAAILLWLGYREAATLPLRDYLLDTEEPEPPDFVRATGRLIRKEFPPDTEVLCNFAGDYSPQLLFYSQRSVLNGLVEADDWKDCLNEPEHRLGGLIWLGAPEAQDILAVLNSGSKKQVDVGGIPFCVWKSSKPR